MSNLLNKSIRFVASEKDVEVLEKKAKKTNLSKSELLRQAIYFTEIKESDKEYQNKKLFLLNNIANNINQIAKYCNTKKGIHLQTLNSLNEVLNYTKAIAREK